MKIWFFILLCLAINKVLSMDKYCVSWFGVMVANGLCVFRNILLLVILVECQICCN